AFNGKGGGPRTAGPEAARGPRAADPNVVAPRTARPRAGSGPPAAPRHGRLGWILGLTSAAYFMVVLDSLVVITALPQMQRSLHVGLPTLQWTVNSYGFAIAIASSVFAAYGHLGSPAGVTAGFRPALAVAAVLSLLGAVAALAVTAPAGQAGAGWEPVSVR
ncbi:MAG TPA: hypothetical protein VGJ50_14640, partial [Streptosporangiaceae bacterium]